PVGCILEPRKDAEQGCILALEQSSFNTSRVKTGGKAAMTVSMRCALSIQGKIMLEKNETASTSLSAL
ncbi:MAG: hypothetical protein QW081_05850, partial [Desulfurococcaceae archaeon]